MVGVIAPNIKHNAIKTNFALSGGVSNNRRVVINIKANNAGLEERMTKSPEKPTWIKGMINRDKSVTLKNKSCFSSGYKIRHNKPNSKRKKQASLIKSYAWKYVGSIKKRKVTKALSPESEMALFAE